MKPKQKTNCKRKTIPSANRQLAGKLSWINRKLKNLNPPEKVLVPVKATPPAVNKTRTIPAINLKLFLVALIITLSIFTVLTLVSNSNFTSQDFSSFWNKLSGHEITGAEISVSPIEKSIVEEIVDNESFLPSDNLTQEVNQTQTEIPNQTEIQSNLRIQGTATSSRCGTVDADLTLTANIVNYSTCFTIAANNIILDGAGYTITGNGSSSYGINFDGYDNVTVKNFGGINNFSTAIGDNDGDTGQNNTFFNNTIITVRDKSVGGGIIGIYLRKSVGINVSSNTIYLFGNNTGIGASSGTGILLLSTNSSIISSNIINTSVEAGGGGIVLDSVSNLNNVTNNIITTGDESQRGIYLRGEGANKNIGNRLIANNITCNNNGAQGIRLEVSVNSTLSSNNVTINGDSSTDSAGIWFTNSSFNELSSNLIITNGVSTPGLTLPNSDGTAPNNNNNITSNNITVTGTNSKNIDLQNSINNQIISNTITSYSKRTDGWEAALSLSGANYTLISSNIINIWNVSNHGLLLSSAYYNNVTNNIITTRNQSEKGIHLRRGSTGPNIGNRLIANNITCNNNNAVGISLEGSFNSTLSSNNVTINGNSSGSDSAGVMFTNSSFNELSSNLIITNGAGTHGLSLPNFNGTAPNNNNNITSNTIIVTGTSSRNINLQNSINNQIISNNLTSYSNSTANPVAALLLDGSNYTLINSNVIIAWNATTSGIYLTSYSFNGSYSNNISYNIISAYGGGRTYGLYISEFSNFTRVLFNNITAANFTGIHLKSGSNVFQNNSIINSAAGYELAERAINNNITSDRLINNTNGIEIKGYSGNKYNNIFRDVQLINNTADLSVFVSPRSNLTFINSSINRSRISVSVSTKAVVKWYVDVNVTDTSLNPISGATVTAYDSLSRFAENTSTNSNGIARLEVIEYYRTNNITFFLTPSTIIAKKANYTSNSTVINLMNQTYVRVNLSLTEVTCGATISSSLDLGNNYNCNNSGLIIGTDNITINGNGYNLTGNGSGTAVSLNAKKNIGITGLKISNFSIGIYYYNTNNSDLTKVTVYNHTYGLIFNNSNNNSVYDSTFNNNSISDVYALNNGETVNSLVNYSGNINNLTINSSAALLLKWYVDVNATFNQNLSLPNANVSGFYNSTGELEYSLLTGSNGLARLILTELKKNSSGTFYLTPHNITLAYASVSGSGVNSTYVNLTRTNNTLVNLSLTLNCTAPALSTNLITNTTILCPGTYQTTDLYAFEIGSNDLALTCDNTILKASGAEDTGINIISKSNVQISGCTFKNYYTAIYLSDANNTVVNNTNITSDGAMPYYLGIGCYYSKNISVKNSFFSSPVSSTAQIILSGCNYSQITSSTLTGDSLGVGIKFFDSYHGVIRNNTFKELDTSLQFFVDYLSSNNTFSYNNFSSNTINIYSTIINSNYNFFNTSVSGYPQGNSYSDYCDKGTDSNNDGYADSGSSSQWPYSENITSAIRDSTSGNAGIVDYGPKLQTCPAAEVFLSSSTSPSTSTADSSSAPPAAESVPESAPPAAAVSESASYYSPAEASQFLSSTAETEFDELGTKIKFILENTGTKRIFLFPQLLQEYDDPFFIITRKTLGSENSFFNQLSGVAYSADVITGRLLKATLKNDEQIILEPGEKKETILEIEEGLKIPRQIKIQFTTLGEVVSEKTVEQKAFSGTAVDLDTENQLMDIYVVIVPISEELEKYYSGSGNTPTGAAVTNLEQKSDEYFLEFTINKNGSSFGDLYGPYNIKENQSLVFAQQIKYNSEEYSGNNVIATKVYRGGKVIVHDEFEVDFGTGTPVSKLSWLFFLLPLILLFGGLSGYTYYVHKQKVNLTPPAWPKSLTITKTQKSEPKVIASNRHLAKLILSIVGIVLLLSAFIFLLINFSQPLVTILKQLTAFLINLGMWIVPIIASIILFILIIVALKLKFKK